MVANYSPSDVSPSDISPLGHFAVGTFRRMDISLYGRFAVYINETFRRQLFLEYVNHFGGQFANENPCMNEASFVEMG